MRTESSHAQRLRLRKWMSVAALWPMMGADDFGRRLPVLWAALGAEAVEGSRFYAEWLIAEGIVRFRRPADLDDLLERLLNFGVTTHEAISVLTVAVVVAEHAEGEALGAFLNKLPHRVVPWVMHPNHTARTIAVHVLERVWSRASLVQPAPGVLGVEAFVNIASMAGRNEFLQRQVDKFVAGVGARHPVLAAGFDPAARLSVHTVFAAMPSCAGERVSAYSFENVDATPATMPLGVAEDAPCVSPPEAFPSPSLPSHEQQQVLYAALQQKADPFVVGVLDRDMAGEVRRRKEIDRRRDGYDVVLVASLLDHAANIGGLCRTAEVMGAAALVVADRRVLADESFRSLAMTAEKWIDVEEVAPGRLQTYLQRMRGDGFRIVAVEQSGAATALADVRFAPGQKVVLVLGNEREGVPAEVLHVADECVEIPQYGVVRSLNAHVAGALVLWEARRQVMSAPPP